MRRKCLSSALHRLWSRNAARQVANHNTDGLHLRAAAGGVFGECWHDKTNFQVKVQAQLNIRPLCALSSTETEKYMYKSIRGLYM